MLNKNGRLVILSVTSLPFIFFDFKKHINISNLINSVFLHILSGGYALLQFKLTAEMTHA